MPPDPHRYHDPATPAPHVSPWCPWRMNCRRFPTRRVEGVEGRPPGDGSLSPRERGGSSQTEGFTASRRPFPRGVSSANFKTTFPDYIKYTNIHTIFERKTNAAFKLKYFRRKIKTSLFKERKTSQQTNFQNFRQNRKRVETARDSLIGH